jgi:hypothetical protein
MAFAGRRPLPASTRLRMPSADLRVVRAVFDVQLRTGTDKGNLTV